MVAQVTIIHPTSSLKRALLPHVQEIYIQMLTDKIEPKNIEFGLFGKTFTANQDKTLFCVLDGMITNKKELESKLAFKGSEEELILKAYSTWGEGFIKQVAGDFGLSLYDSGSETLFFYRDPIGKKTFYWSHERGYFFVATEIKALLATGLVPQNPSITGLSAYLYFGFIPQDMTGIKYVHQLLPSHYLKVDLSGSFAIRQYWSLSYHIEQRKEKSEEEFQEELSTLLTSTFPPTQGKEAALILPNEASFLMAYELKETSTPFYLVEGPNRETPPPFDLFPHQQETVPFSLDECLDDLVMIVWAMDEPLASLLTLRTWALGLACQKAKRDLILDVGWKELFGVIEYPLRMATRGFHLPKFLIHALPQQLKWKLLRKREINEEMADYLHHIALFSKEERKSAFPLLSKFFDAEIFTQRFHRLSQVTHPLEALLYYDAKTRLPDLVLLQYEGIFSHFNQKVITPFLDKRVIEFVAEIPSEVKYDEALPGKMLRKRLLEKSGKELHLETRRGEVPLEWCHHPRLIQLFKKLLKGYLIEEGLVSMTWLKNRVERPISPIVFKQLWAILILEIWFRLFINRPVGTISPKLSIEELFSK